RASFDLVITFCKPQQQEVGASERAVFDSVGLDAGAWSSTIPRLKRQRALIVQTIQGLAGIGSGYSLVSHRDLNAAPVAAMARRQNQAPGGAASALERHKSR